MHPPTVEQTIEDFGELTLADLGAIYEGFDHGNYAATYETENYSDTLKDLNGGNGFYRVGHLLGFFSSYELNEIEGEHYGQKLRDMVEHYRAVFEALNINL